MRALVIGVFDLASALTPFALRPAPSSAPQPQRATTVDGELEKARQLLQQREYFNALKGYQRASQLAGRKSADAFLGMALAMQGMKVYKNAIDASQSAIDLAQGNARLLARAHKLKGQILSAMGDPRGAEAELRAALAADPDSNVADLHYELALALLVQHRDEEAIAGLWKEIEIRPHGTTAEEAQALIANPRRGREKYAPDFSIVSSDGRPISLETLRGRVALLDFWASWCRPCARCRRSRKSRRTTPRTHSWSSGSAETRTERPGDRSPTRTPWSGAVLGRPTERCGVCSMCRRFRPMCCLTRKASSGARDEHRLP
jgi:hypothetical protein